MADSIGFKKAQAAKTPAPTGDTASAMKKPLKGFAPVKAAEVNFKKTSKE